MTVFCGRDALTNAEQFGSDVLFISLLCQKKMNFVLDKNTSLAFLMCKLKFCFKKSWRQD